MENSASKLRKRTLTIVEQAWHEIPGFLKLYQDIEEKVVRSETDAPFGR